MGSYLILKIVLAIALFVVAGYLIYRFLNPINPLDAASSALNNRLFSTIKKPWED